MWALSHFLERASLAWAAIGKRAYEIVLQGVAYALVVGSMFGLLIAGALLFRNNSADAGLRAFDPDDVVRCEDKLIESLQSPSSYRRVSSHRDDVQLAIIYDASNEYGAIIRRIEVCG